MLKNTLGDMGIGDQFARKQLRKDLLADETSSELMTASRHPIAPSASIPRGSFLIVSIGLKVCHGMYAAVTTCLERPLPDNFKIR
jgi:hypothetical protein